MGSQRRIRHKLFEWLRRYAPNEIAGWVGHAVNQRVRADMLARTARTVRWFGLVGVCERISAHSSIMRYAPLVEYPRICMPAEKGMAS